MDLRNSNGIQLRNFYFTTVQKPFLKFPSEAEKSIMWNSIQVLLNQVSKNPSIRYSVKELLFYNRTEAFSEISIRNGKMHYAELNSGTSKSSK